MAKLDAADAIGSHLLVRAWIVNEIFLVVFEQKIAEISCWLRIASDQALVFTSEALVSVNGLVI